MPRFVVLAAVLALACSDPVATAQAAPAPRESDAATVKRLLAKAVEWQGGSKALGAVRYVVMRKVLITLHGVEEGQANQVDVRGLNFGLARDGKPERLRFYLKLGKGRAMGLGPAGRYWSKPRGKPGFYLSPKKDTHKSDIDRLVQARDVLRYLLMPDLIAEGTPFESRGHIGTGEKQIHILQKKDRKGRNARLLVRNDGTVQSVARTETMQVPVDEDGDGEPDPDGKTKPRKVELRVLPSKFIEVEGPAGKVKLPTRIEVRLGGRPWITCVLSGDKPYKLPKPGDFDTSIFKKPK